jgi:hypothetical protein
MNKKLVIFCCLMISLSQFCFSQKIPGGSTPVLFRGVVMDASSQERLPGSKIVINRSRSVAGAEDGTFSFYAFKKDTVVFSLLGFKPASLIISDTISGKEFLTGVYLESDTLLLGEVIILPRLDYLKGEMMNPKLSSDQALENAVSNITIASYVGRTTEAKMGDARTNYDVLRTKMKYDAYERGGIPSDKILGLSPLLLIPAAYMLIKGVPEIPEAPKAHVSTKDINELQTLYREFKKKRK